MVPLCPALVAPFLAERVLDGMAPVCALMACPGCDFRCFDIRLDAAEMDRLYRDYRGGTYFSQRNRWEPWYTRGINDSLGRDPADIADRKRLTVETVASQGAWRPRSILDFGGDHGQFIPDAWEAGRYVLDLSGKPPVAGVEAFRNLAEAGERRFDLVMTSQVFEHLSDPWETLGTIRSLVAPSGLLYLDVPLERPDIQWARVSPWDAATLPWLAARPRLLRWLDFYSSAARVKANLIPPLGFLKASEHLNFFSAESLHALFARAGFQTLQVRRHRFRTSGGVCDFLVGLARLPQGAGEAP